MSLSPHQTARPGWFSPEAVVCVAIAAFVARGLVYWDFLPIWDSRLYTDCLGAGVTQLGRGVSPLRALNCFDHPTMGYVALLAGPLKLAGYPGVLVANLALGAISIWALFKVCVSLAPGERATAAAIAVVYGCHPQLLANAVSFTADHGVSVFFLLVMWMLTSGRFWWAAAFGLVLVFCKETGSLLYGVAVVSEAAAMMVAGQSGWPDKIRALLRRWPLGWPVVAFAAFLYWKLHLAGSGLWGGTTTGGIAGLMTHFTYSRVFQAYLVVMLVLSFTWVLIIPVMVAPLGWLSREGRSAPDRRAVVFAVLLALGSAWMLTRFETALNARYLFPFAGVLMICAFLAYVALVRAEIVRFALIGLTGALMLVSTYRTVDPVSKLVFGTFSFGDHAMLRMTSFTGECCGRGRDQLQYNLQFTQFAYLTDMALKDIEATDDSWIAMSSLADWQTIGPIDATTHQRVLGPTEIGIHAIAQANPAYRAAHSQGWYFAYANINNAPELADLNRAAVVGAGKVYERGGYSLAVYPFRMLR